MNDGPFPNDGFLPNRAGEEARRRKSQQETITELSKELDSFNELIEELCDGQDCTGEGCDSYGHDEDCEISDNKIMLKRYIGQLHAKNQALHRRAQAAEGAVERVKIWVDAWKGTKPTNAIEKLMLNEISKAVKNTQPTFKPCNTCQDPLHCGSWAECEFPNEEDKD